VRERAVLLWLALLVTPVGCGSSASASKSPTASPPATAQTTAPATTRTATQTATTGTTPETTPTATGAPPTGTQTTTNPAAPASGGAPPSDVRLPATFTILPGGSLSPATITAPAHVPVALTVISGDGRPHRVLLRTPTRYTLTVPAHGRGSILLTGLKAGRYPLDVDGTASGTLVIGGAPGP
jgi:cytoskeletal protein RodZ